MFEQENTILTRFADWFVPESLREGTLDTRRRTMVVMWFWLAVVFWSPFYAAVYYWLGDLRCTITIVIGALLALTVPYSLKRTRSIWIAGNFFTVTLTCLLMVLTLFTGGHHSPVRMWFVLIPPLAVALAGMGSALFWTLVVVAFNGSLFALDMYNVVFATTFSEQSLHILNIIAFTTLLILVGTLGVTYDRSYCRMLAVADRRTQELGEALGLNELAAIRLKESNEALTAHIRERQRAEQSLRESEQLLSNVVSTIPFYVFWKDRNCQYLGCNQLFAQIAGYSSPREVIGKSDYDMAWTKEEADWYRQCDLQVMASGKPMLNIEETLKQSDGSIIELLTSKVPLRDSQGQVMGLLGIFADITERKNLEQRLRLQSSALAATANAVVITDSTGKVVWVNPAFTALTGYASDEVIGQNPAILKSGEHDAEFYRQLWSTIASGSVWQGEIINRRKNGSLYHEDMTIAPVRGAENRITHFVAIKQDITDRLRAERLANERDRLRDSVKAHEHLIGVVGHELRTPLAGLMIIAEFLQHSNDRNTAEFDSFLGSVLEEVQRMSGTVNDLLEVARLDSGIAKWNWGEVDVHKACSEAAASIRPLIDAAQISLTVHVHPEDLAMRGDAAAIRRLLINLLSNASKHTSEGAITLDARVDEDADCRWIEFTVTDTGTGMTPETAARLGEAFALNSGVIGEKYVSGSGLGLAICRGIVTAHGGTFRVKSRLNEGTTCCVRLRPDLPAPAKPDRLVEIAAETES